MDTCRGEIQIRGRAVSARRTHLCAACANDTPQRLLSVVRMLGLAADISTPRASNPPLRISSAPLSTCQMPSPALSVPSGPSRTSETTTGQAAARALHSPKHAALPLSVSIPVDTADAPVCQTPYWIRQRDVAAALAPHDCPRVSSRHPWMPPHRSLCHMEQPPRLAE